MASLTCGKIKSRSVGVIARMSDHRSGDVKKYRLSHRLDVGAVCVDMT